jgi:hypothetical protein
MLLKAFNTKHQIKEHEIGGSCSMQGRYENTYTILAGKPGKKWPLRKHMQRDRVGWFGQDSSGSGH